MTIGEFDLIDRYFTRPARRVALGIGDDCALLAPRDGHLLAVSNDMLVEGRHFLSTVAPERLGHKALAVNLSDLAACGAEPLAFAVNKITVEFLKPARIDDALTVKTGFDAMRGPRIFITQRLERAGETLVNAEVQVCCISLTGRPRKPPALLLERLKPFLEP